MGLLTQIKDLERENQQLTAKLAKVQVDGLLEHVTSVDVQELEGVQIIAAQVNVPDMDGLRQMVDMIRDRVKNGVIVLGAVNDDKVNWVTAVTAPGLKELHAGNIIKEVAKITGGGGGGRPDMAQAGGKDPSKLTEAIDQVPAIIRSLFGK